MKQKHKVMWIGFLTTACLLTGITAVQSHRKTAEREQEATRFVRGKQVVENMVATIVQNDMRRLKRGVHQNKDGSGCVSNEIVSVCLAPGTSKEYAQQVLARLPRPGWGGGIGPQFQLGARWSSTATNPTTGALGTPVTLTYSFVPDGVSVPGAIGEPDSNSVLFSRMGALFGSGNTATWQGLFAQCFTRWSQVAGIRYVQVSDDGDIFPNASGSNTGSIRGDVRIAMHPIDGGNGVLAYNFYPDFGDMVLDSAENWAQTSNNYRFLRNVVMHEHGHGQGLAHVDPLNNTKLMEAFLNTNFDGPQDDDIRGGQRNYGDQNENNNTAATATNLGTASVTTLSANGVSLHTSTDVDWCAIDTPSGYVANITVIPIGSTYLQGPQNGATSSINTLTINNLNFQVYASNGTTLLASASSQPAGVAETISNLSLTSAGNRAYIRVVNAPGAIDDVQRYNLSVSLRRPSVSGTVALQGIVSGGTSQSITFDFRPQGGGSSVVRTATVGSTGVFTVTNVPSGIYDLAIKGAKYLRVVVPNVNTTGGDVTGVTATLLVGDINGDNAISLSDYALFKTAYGSTSSNSNWNPNADLNCDGAVSLADYSLFKANYGQIGAP